MKICLFLFKYRNKAHAHAHSLFPRLWSLILRCISNNVQTYTQIYSAIERLDCGSENCLEQLNPNTFFFAGNIFRLLFFQSFCSKRKVHLHSKHFGRQNVQKPRKIASYRFFFVACHACRTFRLEHGFDCFIFRSTFLRSYYCCKKESLTICLTLRLSQHMDWCGMNDLNCFYLCRTPWVSV